jgi:hypothetical protein
VKNYTSSPALPYLKTILFMWRRILAYFLFGLGFLTITYFRKYSGVIIPHPFLFYLLGLVMFGGGLLLLRYTLTKGEMNLQKKMGDAIKDLKTNGEKIQVDLTQCAIKEHNYMEERSKYGHSNELLTLEVERHIEGWNAISGGSMRNVEQVQVKQAVIIYEHHNLQNGNTEKFISRIIPKDKMTLLFYLDRQKQTVLYVDKNDRNKYYFELDFLMNQ